MSAPMPTSYERVMKDEDFIVSKTDLTGKITYCNEIFMEMAVMQESELLGKPHSIIRHPDMPRTVFKLLWDRVKAGEEIFAFVKNLCADGGYYWVFANVTASRDSQGNIIGYYSVRIKPNPKAVETVVPIYQQLLNIEKTSGLDAAVNHLHALLEEQGVSYDEFVISLQG